MKIKFFEIISISIILVLISCTNISNVEYTEAKNYFHKTNAPLPTSMKITSQMTFDSQFGMATRMGANGIPTAIDFKKSFVLAKVMPQTDTETTLTPLSLTKKNNKLILTYRIIEGAKLSYTTQPMFILLVPKAYQDLDIEEQIVE